MSFSVDPNLPVSHKPGVVCLLTICPVDQWRLGGWILKMSHLKMFCRLKKWIPRLFKRSHLLLFAASSLWGLDIHSNVYTSGPWQVASCPYVLAGLQPFSTKLIFQTLLTSKLNHSFGLRYLHMSRIFILFCSSRVVWWMVPCFLQLCLLMNVL